MKRNSFICCLLVLMLVITGVSCAPKTTVPNGEESGEQTSEHSTESGSLDAEDSSESDNTDNSGVVGSNGQGGTGTNPNAPGGVAASNGQISSKGQGTVSTSSKKNESKPVGTVNDFGGYEFVFGTAYFSNYKNSQGVLDPTNALMKAVAKVEKEYNCKVKFMSFPSVSAAGTQIINAVMSGTKLCDVAEVQFSRARTVAKAKACLDLKTLPGLDLNNGNFSEPMTFANTFNNKVYATYAGAVSNIQGLFYNKQLLSTYAPGNDIEKMYKEGTWTEANFEKILRTIKAAGKVGLTGETGILALTSSANAGGTTYKDKNNVIFGIVSENGVVGLNFVKKLYNDGLWVRGQNFNSGAAVFTDGALWNGKSYADVNKGFIPWPKGLQNQYIMPMADGPAWCVPSNVSKKDYAGTILNALSEASAEFQQNMRQEYAAAGFSGNSLDVIMWGQKNHRVDLTTGPDISAYSAKIDDSVFNKSSEPASAMQTIRGASQQVYNDYYGTFGK